MRASRFNMAGLCPRPAWTERLRQRSVPLRQPRSRKSPYAWTCRRTRHHEAQRRSRACRSASSWRGASRSAPSRTSSTCCGSPPTRATASRPILCGWTRALADDGARSPRAAASSCSPNERLGDPARFDYLVVVGGLVDEIENLHPDTVRFLRQRGRGRRAAGRRLHRHLHPAPRRADARATAPASAGSTTTISSSGSTG